MMDKGEYLSGKVFQGTINASNYAYQLTHSVSSSRSCGIAIANESHYLLQTPRHYEFSGSVDAMPLEISPGFTGLILGRKSYLGFRGSVGVLSYELIPERGLAGIANKLHLMWHVPFDHNLYQNMLNVTVDFETACEDLYWRMYSGEHGLSLRACDTAYTYDNLRGNLKATVMMSDKKFKSSLVILLRSVETDREEN